MSTRRTMAQWREILNTATPAQRADIFRSNARVKRELSQYFTTAPVVVEILEPLRYGPFPPVLRKWYDCPREQSPAFRIANAFAAGSARRIRAYYRRTHEEMINAQPRDKNAGIRDVLDLAYVASEFTETELETMVGIPSEPIIWAELPEVEDISDWSEAVAEDTPAVRLGDSCFERIDGRWVKTGQQRDRSRAKIVKLA